MIIIPTIAVEKTTAVAFRKNLQNFTVYIETIVSHQWCDLFSSTTAQLYATHRKREWRRKRHRAKYTGFEATHM
jgi:hypothetical protein